MQTSFDKENVEFAGFFSRLAAFLMDCVLINIGLLFVKIPVWCVELAAGDIFLFKPFLFNYTVCDVVYYLITVAYFVVMTYSCGATIGKHLMKIKVVDTNGEKLSFISVLIRETVGRYLSVLIVYVGYILAGLDKNKQGLHDKIADTYVIYDYSSIPVPVKEESVEESETELLQN